MLRLDINMLFEIINLLILFVAFRLFLFKPVQNIIARRREEADKTYEEANALRSEADAKKAEYEKSLLAIEDERNRVMSEARKSANEEYVKIVEHANRKAQKIHEEACAEAENQKAQILKKAEGEIAEMVISAAAKMVAEEGNDVANRALYDEFIDKAGDQR